MTSHRRRRASAAVAALAVGTAGLLAASPAAAADPLDLSTPNVEWSSVRDDAAYIEDARALYQDYRGSGLSVYGFTDDAFDGFLEAQGDSAPGTSQTLVTLGATSLPLVVTPVSSTTVGGLTTLVASGTVNFGDGNTLSLTRTLEIQASFARWSWVVTEVTGSTATDYTISEVGNLGSDEDSTFVPDGPNRLVSYEDGGSDMIIGYSFANAAYSVADFDDSVSVSFTADQDAVLTVAVIDYDPCSFDAALAGMQSAVATLAADFGDTLPSCYADDCLTVEVPALITGATDQRLDITESDDLETNWDYIYGGSIADPTDGLTVTVLSAPAGLSFSLVADDVENDEPQLRMTGTPTDGGEVRLLFAYTDGEDNFNPLVVTFDVEVGLAETGASDAAPAVLAIAVGLLGVGGVLLLARRRFARR